MVVRDDVNITYQALLVLGLHGFGYLAHCGDGCGRAAEENRNSPSPSSSSDDDLSLSVECPNQEHAQIGWRGEVECRALGRPIVDRAMQLSNVKVIAACQVIKHSAC